MATTPQPFSLTNLFQNPDFINMLAGIGAEMDPSGPGGILGRAAITMNKAQAASRAAQATLHKQPPGATVSDIAPTAPLAPTPTTAAPNLERLSYTPVDQSTRLNEIQDLLTPPGEVGPTSISRDKAGEVNVKLTPPPKPVNDIQAGNAQADVADLLEPFAPRRSLPSGSELTYASLPAVAPAPQITPQTRANDRSVILTPRSSEEDYIAAIAQGARRRNLDENVVLPLVDSARTGARNQRSTDKARFDTDPNYRVNVTLDYLDSLADTNPNLRPKTSVQTTVPQPTPTQAEIDATLGTAPRAPLGSTEVISPGGIPEVPAGTRMSIPNLIYTPPASTERAQPPAPAPVAKTEPAKEPTREAPTTTRRPLTPAQADIDRTLDTAPSKTAVPPLSNIEPESISVNIEKESPALPVRNIPQRIAPAELVSAITHYDLRGLNPAEVDRVVGRVLEARRTEAETAASMRAGQQLIETDSGYAIVNRATGTLTPLTSEGKVDAKQLLAQDKFNTLSNFSKEMSLADSRVRSKMNESQSKSFEYGSRALQANERQKRLEEKYASDPTQFATRRASILATLESLPPDMPMNVVGTILGVSGAVADTLLRLPKEAQEAWERLTTGKSEWKDLGDPVRRALEVAGLGPAAARVYASLGTRKDLTEDEREFLQNSLEFSTAMLRRESGAAINAGEFLQTYRQYFPAVGDTRRDVLRKMRTRQQAIRGMRTSAGRPLLAPDVED